ncbi:glycosyltransferase [Ancylobacter sonchi]|uniref:glycosyltransferase n=1 Tax=Ancylobacter sonchi TaxID=1937790 RepID=UPI001BD4F452|nr:glycosyltransferase [Ancylobacter sonchi]MBS7536147.1 glycosyltransferase [Ancylobacter sonchi]
MDLLLSRCPAHVSMSRISNKKISSINEDPTPGIVFVNWEEQLFNGATSAFSVRAQATRYLRDLRKYKEAGGRIAWLIHNAHPHSDLFTHHLTLMRQKLAGLADVILHQNVESLRYLEHACPGLDPAKNYYLPHPSYLSAYALRPALEAERKSILIFGRLLPYKNLEWFIRFHELHAPKIPMTIAGQSDDADYIAYLRKAAAADKKLSILSDRIPDEALAELFDKARCIVLTDDDTLNSGIAHLALQGGAIIVAPDTAYYREVLPPSGHRYFYQSNHMSLKTAIRLSFKLDAEGYRQLIGSYMRRAQYVNSDRISDALFGIFEAMLEKGPAGVDAEAAPAELEDS